MTKPVRNRLEVLEKAGGNEEIMREKYLIIKPYIAVLCEPMEILLLLLQALSNCICYLPRALSVTWLVKGYHIFQKTAN